MGEGRYVTIETLIKDLLPKEKGYCNPDGIIFDENDDAWININRQVIKTSFGESNLLVQRTDTGYKIDISGVKYDWKESEAETLRIDKDYTLAEKVIGRRMKPGEAGVRTYAKPEPDRYAQILSPFKRIFLADELIDEIALRVSIPDLLEGKEPKYGGAVIHGPPGTGKSVLMRAIMESYTLAGAYAEMHVLAEFLEKWVGSLARHSQEMFSEAREAAQLRGLPSFVCLDEATSLVMKASAGEDSNYYQEGLDSLKSNIGNFREVVFCMTTNEDPKNIDDALIREGRLSVIKVDYPDELQRKRMWRHFMKENDLLQDMLNDDCYAELAHITPGEHGALIEEYCRTAIPRTRLAMAKEIGASNLIDAYRKGIIISEEDAHDRLTYQSFI
ncbi:hypothetical protein COV93_05470, partial [Candidatus Woesearchaeota archaeon CG11_big_fil_rev_8_21_14_0_20_43_8]